LRDGVRGKRYYLDACMNAEEEARKDKSIYIVVHTPVIPGMSVELRT
jgi:hypothetical protein